MTLREFHLLRYDTRITHLHPCMQMRGHVTPTAESWKSSHPSSYTGSRLPATSIHTDEAQTLPISRQFRERVYPLEYVALIKYNELSLSLSRSVW